MKIADFTWKVELFTDFSTDTYHQEQYPGHMPANIVGRLPNNQHLCFQPDKNNDVCIEEDSGDDYEEILGHPSYENSCYEELREHAQCLYDAAVQKLMS